MNQKVLSRAVVRFFENSCRRKLMSEVLEVTAASSTPDCQAHKLQAVLMPLAAHYFLKAKNHAARPLDPVARFHLGNCAKLDRLNWLGDISERGLRQSHSLMVNYLYDLEHIEKNHETYAQQQAVVAASAITKLVKTPARDVVPAGD